MSHSAKQPQHGLQHDGRPRISRLTRRQFLAATTISLAGLGVGVLTGLRALRHSQRRIPSGYKVVELSGKLCQNPAFLAAREPDEQLLVWVHREDDAPLVFRLNHAAALLWGLCDGRSTEERVCTAFSQKTGRPREEARRFLSDLTQKGLVVRGGYVVASTAFPGTPSPARYLHTAVRTARRQ